MAERSGQQAVNPQIAAKSLIDADPIPDCPANEGGKIRMLKGLSGNRLISFGKPTGANSGS